MYCSHRRRRSNGSEHLREALSSSRLALVAFHGRDYSLAEKYYDQALQADPHNAYLLNLRAYTRFKQKDYDRAIEDALRSVREDPGYAWGYFDLARIYCAAGKPEAAREAISGALDLRPDLKQVMMDDGEFRRLCGELLR